MAVLSIAFLVLPASETLGECLPTGPPRLIEAKVVGCEAPDTHARKAFEDFVRFSGPNEAWNDVDGSLKTILEDQPARILMVHLIRARDAKDGSRWSFFDKPEALQALFLGSNDCADFKVGDISLFENLDFCCCPGPDDLGCLLGEVDLREPSKELLEVAGTAEATTGGEGKSPGAR